MGPASTKQLAHLQLQQKISSDPSVVNSSTDLPHRAAGRWAPGTVHEPGRCAYANHQRTHASSCPAAPCTEQHATPSTQQHTQPCPAPVLTGSCCPVTEHGCLLTWMHGHLAAAPPLLQTPLSTGDQILTMQLIPGMRHVPSMCTHAVPLSKHTCMCASKPRPCRMDAARASVVSLSNASRRSYTSACTHSTKRSKHVVTAACRPASPAAEGLLKMVPHGAALPHPAQPGQVSSPHGAWHFGPTMQAPGACPRTEVVHAVDMHACHARASNSVLQGWGRLFPPVVPPAVGSQKPQLAAATTLQTVCAYKVNCVCAHQSCLNLWGHFNLS